jgi:hypothetical protein
MPLADSGPQRQRNLHGGNKEYSGKDQSLNQRSLEYTDQTLIHNFETIIILGYDVGCYGAANNKGGLAPPVGLARLGFSKYNVPILIAVPGFLGTTASLGTKTKLILQQVFSFNYTEQLNLNTFKGKIELPYRLGA